MSLFRNVSRKFATGQSLWDPKFLSQINKKNEILKVILNELSPNPMSYKIGKYIIITFSIVNNPFPCHIYVYNRKLFFKVHDYILLGSCPEIPC